MKKSYELEDSFKNLNHIPRSQIQKRKTYENIVEARSHKAFQGINGNWAGFLLTISMVLIVSGFLYNQIFTPAISDQAIMSTDERIGQDDVIRTYLTKSDSDHYFELQSNLTRKGIVMQEGETWKVTVSKALNGMKLSDQVPLGKASYDLLVILDGRNAVKCKLWVIDNEVYLKKIKEEQYYKLDTLTASHITKTIEEITKQDSL
ncbi:MAG TPA: hypothetical protein DCR24_10000 [Bacillus bacterium]|nr:hypothetical protein [Bacillus sp. (in: firmicutes)]